jgi:hypothetical protein
MYIGSTGLYIKYFQLEISGKLLGNFDLVTIVPTPSSGARMLYKPAGKPFTVVDGKTKFSNKLSSFTTDPVFNPTANIMPDFPADVEALLSITLGSVVLKGYMALVIDLSVTGSNVFTAQVGAYASATMKVALFVFESLSSTCDSDVFSKSTCEIVVLAAGTTQTKIGACTPPTTTSKTSGKCHDTGKILLVQQAKYLIIQIFDGPTIKSGINGPSLKADNTNPLSISLSIYPIAKLTAYNGMFALYAAPHLKAVITADAAAAGSTTCSGGVEIQVRTFGL